MMAALVRRGPARCRSMQLSLALICPPTNHLANGSFHSSTLSHGFNQCSALAASAQKASGSSLAHWASRSYSAVLGMNALAAKSAGGGNWRVSLRMLVMSEAGEDIAGLRWATGPRVTAILRRRRGLL